VRNIVEDVAHGWSVEGHDSDIVGSLAPGIANITFGSLGNSSAQQLLLESHFQL
jgi:hypothetical protein